MAMDLLNVDDENPQDGSDDSDDVPSLEIWRNNEENAFAPCSDFEMSNPQSPQML
jgi:hypothetical protein